MIICQILGGNEEGGLEKHVEELSNALSEQAKVHVIACEKYRDRFKSEVAFHAVDLARGRRNPFLLASMVQKLKEINPDIIHAHASKATQVLASIKRWVPGKKIATLHGFRKKLSAFNTMDGVIAINAELAETLSVDQVAVIPNGLLLPQFIAKERPEILTEFRLKAGKPFAIAIGRLVKAKAYRDLLQAWRTLDMNLMVIGEGEERPKLEALVKELGLADRVRLVGHRDSAFHFLPACDFLVISSLSEGGPYTLVEALLLGVPVVSTRVGMCADWLPADCLCEPGEVPALENMIFSAGLRAEKLKQEFKPIFEIARERLSLGGMAATTYSFYQQVISGVK
jgi:glycosyltransferase involved in cell wall biosynthesis